MPFRSSRTVSDNDDDVMKRFNPCLHVFFLSEIYVKCFLLLVCFFFFLYQALFIHFSLAGVIFKRGSWPKEQKPQVWSGPNPCYDKDGNPKFVCLHTNAVNSNTFKNL